MWGGELAAEALLGGVFTRYTHSEVCREAVGIENMVATEVWGIPTWRDGIGTTLWNDPKSQ